jgi:predicted site-specific integrase-resolvase
MGALDETRLSPAEAAEFAGVHLNTINSWRTKGLLGHKLESVHVGRKVVTSKEAVKRFVAKLNPGTAGPGAA